MTHLTPNEKSRLNADRELLITANKCADDLIAHRLKIRDSYYYHAATELMRIVFTKRIYRDAIADCGLVITLRCLEQELLEKVKSLSQLKGQDTIANFVAMGLRVLRKYQSPEHCHTSTAPSFYPTSVMQQKAPTVLRKGGQA